MANSQAVVARLYQDVIDDVIKNMKQEFENEGVDDQVLQELQNLWEVKLQELTKQEDDEEDAAFVNAIHRDDQPTYMYPHQGPHGDAPGGSQGADVSKSAGSEGGGADGATGAGTGSQGGAQTAKPKKSAEAATKAKRNDGEDDESEFSDLGDDLDSSGDDEPETDDLVLCQFEKVTRTKNKWKTTLKDGVMRIGGRDYVFHKGLGEFEW